MHTPTAMWSFAVVTVLMHVISCAAAGVRSCIIGVMQVTRSVKDTSRDWP